MVVIIADKVTFDSILFPNGWNVPNDLKGEIFVGGISIKSSEVYYLVDFDNKKIKMCEIDIGSYAKQMKNYLVSNINPSFLPYGIQSIDMLPVNFLQPHEAFRLKNKNIIVAMHNAPYMRIINFDERLVTTFPESNQFEPIMLSATNSLSNNNARIFYSESLFVDRLKRYKDGITKIKTSVKSCNYDFSNILHICDIATDDAIHETKISPDEKNIILTEFCLVAKSNPPIFNDNVFKEEEKLWHEYRSSGLYKTNLYIVDNTKGNTFSSIVVNAYTPGHIEFSLYDRKMFYLSCHNLSKANGRVILHGHGKLLLYKINNHQLSFIDEYIDDDFYRITSHKVIQYNNEQFIVVTGYPNKLFIFVEKTFKLFRVIELFPSKPIEPHKLHFSILFNHLPIWLETSSNNRYIMLISNSIIYIYDMKSEILTSFPGYSFNNNLIGSAHVTNLQDFDIK